jgi:ABC-type xylose transport system permease subunit
MTHYTRLYTFAYAVVYIKVGGISNVLVETTLIAILINGMNIMDLAYTTQNLIKAVILLRDLVYLSQ